MRCARLPHAAAGWLGVLVLALVAPASAQPLFDRFTRASGLPSDYVMALHQDADGFVWFGTDTGVARYDGRSFRSFTTADGLPHNLTYDFAEYDGTLYVATFRGLARWTGSGFSTVAGSEGQTVGQLLALSNALLARTSDALYRVAGDSMHVVGPGVDAMERIGGDRALLFGWSATTSAATVLPDGGIAVGEADLLGGGRLRHLWVMPGGDSGSEAIAGAVVPGTRYLNWYRAHVSEDSIRLGEQLRAPQGGGRLRDVERIDAGLIAGAERSVWLLRDTLGADWRKLLDSPRVEDVLVDYEGGTWIGTFGRGAYRLRALHLARLGEGSVVRMQHVPDGDVLFTTEAGVWRCRNSEVATAAPELIVQNAGTREVMPLGGGLAISNGPSLIVYDAQTVDQIRTDPTATRNYLVSHQESNWWSGIAMRGDTLWGSTYGNGIRRFWPGGTDTLGVGNGVPDLIVEGLTTLGPDVWVLTRGSGAGVYRDGRFRTWNRASGLPSNVVFSAYLDTFGDTWLGTDRGAARVRGDESQTFASAGLDGRRLLAFFERPADPGIVWGVTSSALVRFDATDAERTPQVVGGFDLVPTAEASVTGAVYLAQHDRLLVGTTEGLVVADLSTLRSVAPPRIAFTSALLDGVESPMRRNPAGDFDLGELRPNVRELSLAFTPLAFQNRLARAEYRLEGGEWRDGSARSLTFAPPTPGVHRVEVRAVGSDGQVSARVQRLAFVVLPSWWQTAWARVLGGLALIGLGVGGTRWAVGMRHRREVRELETQTRERQRISRDLHDHVGSQLTGLIAGLELAEHERDVGQVAELRGEARNALSQLRRTVWALGTRSGDASELAREIERHVAEQSRFVAHPHLAFEAQVEVAHVLTATEALHLVRIAQEAIQNAIKHANADRIAVGVRADASGVGVSVVDDGAFVPPSPHSGSGLSYVRERAAEIGAELTLDGGDVGTRVEVRLRRS